ncbi:MAG: dephospho-CoA kinase [Candidatus Omnitrophica bacterium]|nr:dephospho-CoA kinase [Candidatus Omnitrophota bacterium]
MVIGITGSFGTGKTFVASIFRSLGAKVLDADKIAHEVIRKGTPEYRRIVKLFGKEILTGKAEIDRKKLGKVVFSNAGLLRKLSAIVHPQVIKKIKRSVENARKDEVVVIDAPLLIEANLNRLVDKLVVVKCSKRRQIKRCQEKSRMQKKEISRVIKSQMPLKRKTAMADIVIDNSRTKAHTRKQVRKVWGEKLWK